MFSHASNPPPSVGGRRWAGRACRVLIGVLAVLGAVLFGSSSAFAHTDFSSSDPADGAVLDAPVTTVTVVFTNPARLAGDGFVALDADGRVRTPASVTTVDDRAFVLTFDPALAGGDIGIRWKVQAGDAHPIEGSFSFTVDEPVPVATSSVPSAEVAGGTASPASSVAPSTDDGQPTSLDDFLTEESSTGGQTISTIGRVIGLLGVVLGIGAFAFLAFVLRGTDDEIEMVAVAVRSLGVVIAIGAAVEYVGVTRIADESLTSALATSSGIAAVLRVVGGLALASGLALDSVAPVRRAGQARRPRALSADVLDLEGDATVEARGQQSRLMRWYADQRSWPAVAGVGAVAISFWFDGHTVSKGPRPLHAVVNSVHLLAGSVWAGGVVVMAVVLWQRYRHRRRMRAHDLLLRFSPLATVSLAAIAAAGLVMAVFVLDSFGELTSTEWGQILLLKTAAVALAALGGAYNHFRLVPALDATPDDEDLQTQVRSTVTAEAILLVFVIVVTAWLVTAAS